MNGGHTPLRIDVRKQAGEMEIEWKDGGIHRIRLSDLRKSCPCATCAEQREQPEHSRGLHVIGDAEMAATDKIQDVRPVGRYAIQIAWRDGHDAGIYTYRLLWELGERTGEKASESPSETPSIRAQTRSDKGRSDR